MAGSTRPGALPRAELRHWAVWASAGLILLAGSRYGLDHRVARYVHERTSFPPMAHRLVRLPELLMMAGIATTLLLGAWSAFVGRLSGVWRDLLLAAISLCIALTVTDALKLWFGRIPPLRWYEQQWRNSFAYLSGSFPSGHMTAMSALAPFLWARSRSLSAVYAAAGSAAAWGLVMQQAHFVSDLVGGVLVGGSVGYGVLCASRRE